MKDRGKLPTTEGLQLVVRMGYKYNLNLKWHHLWITMEILTESKIYTVLTTCQ